ncbi:MAG: uncharacterized protein KVP18_003246 [Porospora cf. gigantea A]|uniref:uncharacterized protein n=1 Tax=Porospora cf. gigantea A TaxID=2853593 RepID=UPI00355A527F|nr:MAG: hypothetical protein KVP18_003246 [Porospora cf. gigantea A]
MPPKASNRKTDMLCKVTFNSLRSDCEQDHAEKDNEADPEVVRSRRLEVGTENTLVAEDAPEHTVSSRVWTPAQAVQIQDSQAVRWLPRHADSCKSEILTST